MLSLKFIKNQLFITGCLIFGHHSKVTSKKVALYLLGTRGTTEIFKLYEMRYLLLKIYPLIHTLFTNPRPNPKLKFQNMWITTGKPTQDGVNNQTNNKTRSSRLTWPFKQSFSFMVKRKNTPPQILFASVTPMYSDIIYNAAQICNMPWHKNRWLSGSITAAISYPSDKLMWQYLQDSTQKQILQAASTQWGKNKENEEKTKEKIKHYSHSRWPSLVIIPDISNNTMILKEAKKVGLPIIGLINSNCPIEIDYPIFAQDQTIQSVHFFCHFLAALIAKETVFIQHKRYTSQKISHNKKEFLRTKQRSFEQKKQLHSFKKILKKKKKFTLNKGLRLQKFKAPWQKVFFFNVFKPWKTKFSRRYFMTIDLHKYHPLFSKKKYYKKKYYKKKKYKKKLPYLILKAWRKKFKIKTTKKKIKHNKKKLCFKILFGRFFKLPKQPKISFVKAKNILPSDFKKSKFLPVYKKIFLNESKKKYFHHNKHTLKEKRQLSQKLRNFLWLPKMIRRLKMRHRFFPKPLRFPATSHYFKHSLQQWSQNFKWTDHLRLIKKLLFLKPRQKENLDDNDYYDYKHKNKHRNKHRNKHKHMSYKKGFRYQRNKNKRPKTSWKNWVKQNLSTSNKISFYKNLKQNKN